ncbi:ExbD/TolR family protein [Calycomorphotria hydatis]|uniref:Biopolymer transport protein ExbD n=1 Tax=Calycomorphotria hydatis TaxID=2528027 RepID=A0A517TBJ7_9PLAN|nr:biopolymer transporter ExbD [Calycomorphotria hydatis]QDT65740.1 Biopolymer transport protein ExbD [Calycomorphotria hydatis]
MPLKTQGIEEPTLNLTPMIDIVFLLIIFFMVGARFTQDERRVEIRLPSTAEKLSLTPLPDPITIGVKPDGDLLLNGQPITGGDLSQQLMNAKENYPGQAVVLKGDEAVPYQSVVDVLVICRQAGIDNISLALSIQPREG